MLSTILYPSYNTEIVTEKPAEVNDNKIAEATKAASLFLFSPQISERKDDPMREEITRNDSYSKSVVVLYVVDNKTIGGTR
jgi:hypothetical protein